MQTRLPKVLLFIVAMVLAKPTLGSEGSDSSPPLTKVDGITMLDYQTISIKGYKSIDLLGFHFLSKFNDWLYFGVGGHAPLLRGDYGGFMAFDATIHAQRKLFGNWSADVGASLGGGGGGRSVEQSKVISGTGGFTKAYVGLGYQFSNFTVGASISKVKFTKSAIDGTQLGLYIQSPFSYLIGSYENSGARFSSTQNPERGESSTQPDDTIIFGLDNIVQIKPKGSYKKPINLIDVQFNHYLAENYYLLFGGSVGYHGLPIYNQVFGGLGYRYNYSPRFNVYSQLALGSGGYAPEKIDTGPGLLVYPKLSAEYRLSKKIGLSVSGGYLFAPRGSSRNITLGASLNYRMSTDGDNASDAGAKEVSYSGHRFHIFQQSELSVKIGDKNQGPIRLLSVQIDNITSDNFYIPVQGSVAYNAFLGYPGYGELLVGIGVQNKYSQDNPVQIFSQLLAGTNVHGIIAKPAVGINYGLSDRLAVYGQVGATYSLDGIGLYRKEDRFRSTSIGLGLSYRFSVLH